MLFADLVLYNGTIHTLGANSGASALAIREGKVVFVGSDATVLELAGPDTKRVDLAGKTVVPGFCDAHVHFASFGLILLRVADVADAESLDAILDALTAQAERAPTEWIQGRGFDQEKLPGRRFPTREELDRVSKTRPIVLTRVCGHAAVANSAAIALLTDEERALGDPESGLYTEEHIRAFYRRIPQPSEAEMETAILRACDVALRTGITSVGCLIDTPEQLGGFVRLHRKGKLPLRVTMMPHYALVASLHANGISTGFGDRMLKFGGAKFFSDGSLGARTALLAAPYADDPEHPDNVGIRIYDPADLKAKAADAQAKGFQLVIHAIGDQANRETLDAIEFALGPDGDNTQYRHRIEHTSLLPPDLLKRMADRSIIAVVQPQFVPSDFWTGERVGVERAPWAYPFRSMLEAGIPLALSSDCPVERMDAFACLSAVVNRAPWSPDGCLTVEQALHAYSYGSAYSLHADSYLGTLEPGKEADFVVLSDDPTRIDPANLRQLRAESVAVSGAFVGPSA